MLLPGSIGLQAAELSDISNTETKNVIVNQDHYIGSGAISIEHSAGENGFGADAAGQEYPSELTE